MPVFARRRLQTMLDEIGPKLSVDDAKDLHTRLEHKNTQTALAAEFELALLWAIARIADIEIAPQTGSGRPDAASKDLFPTAPAIIEITAVSDDTFSGQKDMDRAANILTQFADRIRRGASRHLYFEFREIRDFSTGKYRRLRRVTKDFQLTPALKLTFQGWLESPDWPAPQVLRLTNDQIDVVIRWKEIVHPLFRVHSTMPAVAYDLEDNNLFKALRKKDGEQLSDVPEGYLRCIFLADAGCRNLRWLDSKTASGDVSGQEIIRHFLITSKTDMVCVFAPQTSSHPMAPTYSKRWWMVTLLDRRNSLPANEYDRIKTIVDILPDPLMEGSQARSLHRQGHFHPQTNGRYRGTDILSGAHTMKVKISARLVQEMLAGRVTQKTFQEVAFGIDSNQFERQLHRGWTIRSAQIESGGIDRDDDHVVFEFAPDPAASPLTNPKAHSS